MVLGSGELAENSILVSIPDVAHTCLAEALIWNPVVENDPFSLPLTEGLCWVGGTRVPVTF